MALSYYLELSTKLDETSTLRLLASRIKEANWSLEETLLTTPTLTINASKPRSTWRQTIMSAFGFDPLVSVGFRFINTADHASFKEILLHATLTLLEHAGDAVLLFNGEVIVLQRIGGTLTVNQDYHLWESNWLKARLPASAEFRSLPSPLL